MPLVPPVLPSDVESVGALTPQLLNLPDQASLDAFVEAAIDASDAWMQGHLGANYGLSQFDWQVTMQRRGQIYLALEKIVDTIKASKVYGTHYSYISEESPNYEALIDNEWGIRALEMLDLWTTLESATRHFALPLFLTSSPLIENEIQNSAVTPLNELYAELLDRARGLSNPDVGSVRR